MIQKIRTSRASKIIACYLSIQMITTLMAPTAAYASTSGPSQPEFNSFTPIGTSDIVNLSTGDFNYNIPLMDVGGYPINLAYDSGITMDQEASWVGLGWNVNVGQINRQVRGLPDDFKGDGMIYENDMKENITVGSNFGISGNIFGFPDIVGLNMGMGVQYNNYEGITFHPSFGVSFGLHDNVSVGVNISSSTADGATVSPNVSIHSKNEFVKDSDRYLGFGAGLSINSRKGLQQFSLSPTLSKKTLELSKKFSTESNEKYFNRSSTSYGGGVISLNDNNLYTPAKRAGTVSGNFSFKAALGTEVFGIEIQGDIMGYGSYQKIRSDEKLKTVPAYGYDYTEYADKGNSILDFNREKDRTFNKNTTVLPIANHTYDLYVIQGQGLGGMFRPHRGQVSYLMDNKVVDYGDGASAGAEFGVGWNAHGGADIEISSSYSYSGGWTNGNQSINLFKESHTDISPIDYEHVYYKLVGELNVDSEPAIYYGKTHANSAVKMGIGGSPYNRTLLPEYHIKTYQPGGGIEYIAETVTSKIKRGEREKRNTAIHKVTYEEAGNDPLVSQRTGLGHHTAGFKVLNPDGSMYVYGETAYNFSKEEITVDASGTGGADCINGLISNDGSVSSNGTSDQYLNRIETPAYAHTYLLSSVLSADYEDLTGDGPTIDDLGSYTLFNYGSTTDYYVGSYHWKTPTESGKANYNEGLKTKSNDQKASIIRGEKEVRYLRTIETKTHIAYFKLSGREDAKGANSASLKKLDKIFLFTLPEFNELTDVDNMSMDDLAKQAIKTVHFEYSYELCEGVPNNPNDEGKLTLEKVYFTYRGSNLGMYNPYKFNYGFNPGYNLKGHDIWGNYKENEATGCTISSPLSTSEYPFVEQDKEIADLYSGAWTLTSIDLPSGGKLEIETESDDYQYVQDRKAMQMFKIHGFSNDGASPSQSSDVLYNGNNHTGYIHVKISEETMSGYTGADFLEDYLKENAYKPIYFRALLNMVKSDISKSDYVSGYFEIDPGGDGVITGGDFTVSSTGSGTYVSIPMKMLKKEGGFVNSDQEVNPIAKAGWYFGRTYLNREVYSLGGNSSNTNFISIVQDLVSSIGAVFEIFSGPNGKLQEKQCARKIILDKSWVRLENPVGRKYGGGLRVTRIMLHDQWDKMDMRAGNDNNVLYKQFYGQRYSYDLEDGTSSGVVTYEPNGSAENPFVEPFYDNAGNAKDQLVAPKESNYLEKPFGESFFPSASVTYSRVTVNNLEREEGGLIVKKNATGKIVHEFYTSRDFPTLTDYTDITPHFDPPGPLSNIFNLNVKNHLAFSQGFVVETNDMNGKPKSQRVYPEGQETFISGVDYIYNTEEDTGRLSSRVWTIDKDGQVEKNEVGLIYDVYNDYRENYTESTTVGVNFNVAGFIVFIVPIIVPLPIPDYAYHETKLNTSATTKVVHRTGILKETVAYDLGSRVSTQNLAWDAHTGGVLLTKTVNEYDDSYYSLSYPSHWYYKGMDMAVKNIGLKGTLYKGDEQHTITMPGYSGDLSEIFMPGDELDTSHGHFWVVTVGANTLKLMKRDGSLVNDLCAEMTMNFKIVRSGYRNLQTAGMASVTSMINPVDIDGNGEYNNLDEDTFHFLSGLNDPRIVNASAVEYNEAWVLPWEQNLPKFPHGLEDDFNTIMSSDPDYQINPALYGFNPYLYNVRGEWRANRSYAYLTGRKSNTSGESSPRYEGFYTSFTPFYKLSNTGEWEKNPENSNRWTFASQVTQFSPFGAETENRDALDRYSAAQYGYNMSLPVAVASNTSYRQLGFDGFEDYFFLSSNALEDPHFGLFDPDNTSAVLTQETSHTGRTSIAVTGEASLIRDYTAYCDYEAPYEEPDCDDPPEPVVCTPFNSIQINRCCEEGTVYIHTLSFDIDCIQDIHIDSLSPGGDENNIETEEVEPNKLKILHCSEESIPQGTYYYQITVTYLEECEAPDEIICIKVERGNGEEECFAHT